MASLARHFKSLLSKPVANTGSQLRDHQANERTFLSWTRMGLAFAAMSIALGRLGLIDHLIHSNYSPNYNNNNNNNKKDKNAPIENPNPQSQPVHSAEILASQICQVLSGWSFGYGFFRYVSMRRHLLQGRFVPALWGPVFMTFGSVGSLGAILYKDDLFGKAKSKLRG
ncbi:hypothetical protein PISL3812_02095 [Talaromyces islandicus]|uniref:DUF202 domain-containing protein n=1 Tax=Talaromyces islandicus TaxID=28573 RepID=A0A0U1LNX4_TALIS|nr:hypothetical protein PISL3812_02095 [Talaromyces islandicus]